MIPYEIEAYTTQFPCEPAFACKLTVPFILGFVAILCGLYHPPHIAAPDPPDIGFAVSPPQQFLRHAGELGPIVAIRDAASTVEVGPDPFLVDADGLYGLIDVIHQVLHRHGGRGEGTTPP